VGDDNVNMFDSEILRLFMVIDELSLVTFGSAPPVAMRNVHFYWGQKENTVYGHNMMSLVYLTSQRLR
jgi:hypothetical protein